MRNRHSSGSRNPEGSTPLTLSLSKGLREGLKGWFDKLTMSGFAKVSHQGDSCKTPKQRRDPGAPLTMSLSKGLREGLKGWFDKLTMSGFAKVSTRGEGTSVGAGLCKGLGAGEEKL